MALRDMELEEGHWLIMAPHPCVSRGCISHKILDPVTSSDMEREVVNKITGSFQSGTKILQVVSLNDNCGSELGGPRRSCEEWWESEYMEVRKRAWATLPSVFGLGV